jgi:hypothetical protein
MAGSMPKSVHITTPWPSSQEIGKRFRIPKPRQKELEALAQEFVRRSSHGGKNAEGRVLEGEAKRKDASAAD